VVFLLYMLNYMDRQVLAAVSEPLKKALELSDTQMGMLQTVFLLCVAGCALPAAFVLDRWSRPKGIAVMAILWSVATALTGLAGSFLMLVWARAAVGIGEAGYSSGGTAMLSSAFTEKNRARVLGLFNASVPLGAALGTVLGGKLAADGNWARPFFVFAVPGVFLAFAALALTDAKQATATAAPPFGESLKKLLSVRTLRITYLAFAMNLFTQSALLYWGPTYFARTFGLDLPTAAKKSGAMMVLAIFGAPLGGLIAHKWASKTVKGGAYTAALTSLLSAIALVVGLLLREKGAAFLRRWGLFVASYLGPGGALTQDVVSPKLRATAWGGCVLSMYLLGGAYSPPIVGKLSDVFGGDMGRALLIVPIGSVLAAILFVVAARSYEADKAAAQAEAEA
jgi:MFS family permease